MSRPSAEQRCGDRRGRGHRLRRHGLLGHYLRARLRRRLFAWFGVTIAVTAALAGGIAWLTSSGGSWWRKNLDNVRTFASHRYAEVWDDASARQRLTRDLAQDLEMSVTLRDAHGQVLAQHGDACADGLVAPIDREGETLGELHVCLDHRHGPRPGPIILWLFVGGSVLWAASGLIAMRLTRPLAQLVRVTKQIGAGQLDARMHLPRLDHNELAILADAVNDMAARIEKQIGDQRELLAAVSHEIRTPLGHVRVLVDLARERGVDDAWIAELDLEILAIDRLVAELLASSRVDFGHIDRRDLDAVELGLRALERAGLDPTLLDADAETATLSADAALLLQALANLLRNAVEHGGGVTTLRVRASADEIVFEVDDDGRGFDDSEIDRAFEPLVRGQRQKPRAGSLGLGLALVRRIAIAHGGKAWAQNREAGGARVTIAIPRHPPPRPPDP